MFLLLNKLFQPNCPFLVDEKSFARSVFQLQANSQNQDYFSELKLFFTTVEKVLPELIKSHSNKSCLPKSKEKK